MGQGDHRCPPWRSALITFVAIFLGSALTMKVQYYKMVYEDEATLGKALLTGLVDLRLLPENCVARRGLKTA